jgi:hypothetical protein
VALLKMAKLGAVVDEWMKAADVQISAVQCWTSLEENLGVVPCTLMSMMSDSLLSSACEVDVCGVLGMHALQLASETPSALLDWNNNYGDDPNKAVCFHCSNLPKHFFKDVKMDFQEIIAGTVGKENTFGTCVGRVKAGAMSFARFSTDDVHGKIRGYSGSGRFTDDPLETFGGAGVVEIPGCRSCCTTSASRGSSTTSRRISRQLPRWCMKPPQDISAGTCTPIRRKTTAEAKRERHTWQLWQEWILARSACVSPGGYGKGAPRLRHRGISSAPHERGSRSRDAEPRRPHARLAEAVQRALIAAKVPGDQVAALAIDTTGSSVIPVGEKLEPLNEYYLWCDHRGWREAALITETAHRTGLEAIKWCGGTYSSEWGFSKLLHWLRHNPDKRGKFASAFEHCDMVAAVLCGITDVRPRPRARFAPWATNGCGMLRSADCPRKNFWSQCRSALLKRGVRAKLNGRYETSDKLAGGLSAEWAKRNLA